MFRISFSGICLFLLTLFIFAPSHAQPLPDRMTLRGTTLDQEGKPVAGVYISVRRQNDMGAYSFWGGEARSDAAGKWEIPDAEEGLYYLNAEMEGFATRNNVSYDFGKENPQVEVRLTRMVKLKLRFTGSDGATLNNTPVFVRFQWVGDGENTGMGTNMQKGRTDAAGNYSTGSLTPAKYALYASSPDAGYYLNTALVIPSNAKNDTVEIALKKGADLRAKIADANGRTLGGATFSLSPLTDPAMSGGNNPLVALADNYAILAASGEQSLLASRDGDGLVQLSNLPPGKYTARFVAPGLSANGNETGDHAVRTVELKSGELSELTWAPTPKRSSSLVLDVRTPNDKPYTFGEIVVRILPISGDGSIFGNREEGEGSFPGAGGTRRVIPDENGRATLFPVRSGRYRLFVSTGLVGRIGKPARDGVSREVGPIDVTVSAGTTAAGGSGTATVVLDEPK